SPNRRHVMDEQAVEKVLEPSISAESLPPNPPRNPPRKHSKHGGPYQPDQRRQAVEAFYKSGMNIGDFARVWGVGEVSLREWVKRYEQDGPKGLERKQYTRAGRPRRAGMREEIAEVQRKYPDFGLRKVRDFLARFHGVR